MSKNNKTEPFDTTIREGMRTIAIEVASNRAIPSMLDGLKPVHRYILWAMFRMGLHFSKNTTKTAKVAGEVMGKYHPHGDCSPSIVTLAQGKMKCNLVHGLGAWGDCLGSDAAASRYTECKLSELADLYLLDQKYLEEGVTEYVSNYLGDDKIPVYLPAKLPFIFTTGSQGIAVGYATNIPTFSIKSVVKVVKKALEVYPSLVKPKTLLALQFDGLDNKVCVSTDSDILSFMKTGKGTLLFSSNYTTKDKTIIFTSLVGNPDTMLQKLEEDDRVYQVNNLSTSNDIKIEIVLKPSITLKDVKNVAKDLYNVITTRYNYSFNCIRQYTKTDADGFKEIDAILKETNPVDVLNEWIKWRVELEVKMLNNQVSKTNDKVNQLEFYRYLISKLDIIFKVLKSKTNDLKGAMKKALKCTDDQAQTVLDMPVRRLSKLSDDELKGQIKDLQQYAKDCKKWLKKPQDKILQDLNKVKV